MSVREILLDRGFIRLLRIRWTGQLTDGIFQSALASFVLFSPERQANAMSAALAFALVLVPYSIVGPFVGTVLDRFSRQRALLIANLTRGITLAVIALLIFQGRTGVELTIFVLIAFGVNRLILAGLSAGLPLVIGRHHLISANALAVTGGSVWVVMGGGIGLGVRKILDSMTTADYADAVIISIAVCGYFSAALFASLLRRDEIGPLPHEIVKGSFTQGLKEMREGIRFLEEHTDAARGIVAIAIQRGGLTALTLMTLVLERNRFNDPLDTEAGLAGVTFMIVTAAVGFVVGAIVAPYGVKIFGRHRWIRLAMLAASISVGALVFARTPLTLAITAFFTALCGQSVKVTNDALVQSKIDDIYRGRVFAVYDVVVNFAIVSGGLLAAFLLPTNGDSWTLPAVIGVGYLATSLIILRPSKFFILAA
ncbi:MAG: MFS transporter [Candidatus Planktophila sp.]